VAALSILANVEDLSGDGLIDHDDVRLRLQLEAVDLGEAGRDEIHGYGLVNGAAASLGLDVTLAVERTLGAPRRDTERIQIAGVPYEVTVSNSGLRRVGVDVFEGDIPRRDLSASLRFHEKDPQEVVLVLDATDASLSVSFTPYGRPGGSAQIALRLAVPVGER
jgi:hypothetical protein